MSRSWLLIICLILTATDVARGDDPLAESRAYALSADGCGLDHGYVCVPPQEEDFIGVEADSRMLPGNWLRAWQVALVDFQEIEDLPPEARLLKHYKFGFAETDAHYVVHFQPLLLPGIEGGELKGIVRGAIGRQTRYWVDKSDFTIARRLFYK
mgnify:FL=1